MAFQGNGQQDCVGHRASSIDCKNCLTGDGHWKGTSTTKHIETQVFTKSCRRGLSEKEALMMSCWTLTESMLSSWQDNSCKKINRDKFYINVAVKSSATKHKQSAKRHSSLKVTSWDLLCFPLPRALWAEFFHVSLHGLKEGVMKISLGFPAKQCLGLGDVSNAAITVFVAYGIQRSAH